MALATSKTVVGTLSASLTFSIGELDVSSPPDAASSRPTACTSPMPSPNARSDSISSSAESMGDLTKVELQIDSQVGTTHGSS